MKHILKQLSTIILLTLVCSKSFAQSNAEHTKGGNTINITSFNVYAKDNKLCVDWSTDGSISTNVFEVQQSTDGINFSTIAMVLGPDPKQKGDNYACSFKNKQSNLKHYYRLRHLDTDGNEQISDSKALVDESKADLSKN